MLFWEEDNSDELTLHCHEIRPSNANWDAIFLTHLLEKSHFLFRVDLNDGGSLIDIGRLVDFGLLAAVVLE